jgi:flagellar motility protein MotE (MotC chaperone)
MTKIRISIVVVVVAGAAACAMVFAQRPAAPTGPSGPAYFTPGPGGYTVTTMPPGGAADAQLAKEYVKAEKEDAKKEIRKKLAESLANQFDQHVANQQKELDDLEKQIATLKDLLKKRAAAKNDIVERRLEQLIRNAEGLGWNAPSSPRTPYGAPMFGGQALAPPAAK